MIPILSLDEAKKRGAEAGFGDSQFNAFRLLLQNPTAGGAAENVVRTIMNRNTIPARTRELVILRTGWRTGSEYEFCRHALRSRQLKISDQDILGVRDPDNCSSYSETDRAVIRMVDELSIHATVLPATMALLAKEFTPGQLVELIIAAGNWRMLATLFRAAKLPLDDDIKSGWPEGKRPPSV
jgi:alkylhydroperoxidase family enzyme